VVTRSSEPFWWSLFGAGGVIAAVLVPVHIVLTGIAAPAGWAPHAFAYPRMVALLSHPLTRAYLFVLIALPLFHWAHRFRFALVDLGLKKGQRAVAAVCYGAAITGTIVAAVVLLRI